MNDARWSAETVELPISWQLISERLFQSLYHLLLMPETIYLFIFYFFVVVMVAACRAKGWLLRCQIVLKSAVIMK